MKDTFIIRSEWYASISQLSEPEQATMFRNLFEFHIGNFDKVDTNTLSLKIIWGLIEPNLKRNISIYDKRCETSATNGLLGGRPKKEEPNNLKNKPKKINKPIETLSDSDSVPVPVSEFDLYIDFINITLYKKYKGNEKIKSSFTARLREGYCIKDFKTAVKNASVDKFHIGENFKFLTPEFFTRQDKLDKFCQEVIIVNQNSPDGNRLSNGFVS